jgi:hypothetical protein
MTIKHGAERALHPAVILCKIICGIQRSTGSRFQDRLMTLIANCRATCHKQRRRLPQTTSKTHP